MTEIKFIRDRKFTGLLVPVYIFMDDLKQPIGVINNGKTLIFSFEGNHQIKLVWPVANSPKEQFRTSEPIHINEEQMCQTIYIRNRYSFIHGSIFYLEQTIA